jgi:hypothetical protein
MRPQRPQLHQTNQPARGRHTHHLPPTPSCLVPHWSTEQPSATNEPSQCLTLMLLTRTERATVNSTQYICQGECSLHPDTPANTVTRCRAVVLTRTVVVGGVHNLFFSVVYVHPHLLSDVEALTSDRPTELDTSCVLGSGRRLGPVFLVVFVSACVTGVLGLLCASKWSKVARLW